MGDTGAISEELSKAEIENTRIVWNLTISKTVIGSNVIYGKKMFENGNLSKQSFKFELREKRTGKVLQTAVTDKDGYFFFDPLEYTLNDLANGDGTYDTSREFVYVVKEVVSASADKKGLDSKSNIRYDLSEREVTIVVTNKGCGLLDVSIKGGLSITFKNTLNRKGVKTGNNGFGNELYILFGASASLIAAL